jgi:hypothetical protein
LGAAGVERYCLDELNRVVSSMSFTESEKARILRESRRILRNRDKPPGSPPSPEPPPVEIKFEDPMDRWRREAAEQEARFAAERAASQRAEREGREAMARARALDGAMERIAALEGRMDQCEHEISALARAIENYSDAVNGALTNIDKQLEKLGTTLAEIRAADDLHRAALDLPSGFIRKGAIN